jgi:hypothetical protein
MNGLEIYELNVAPPDPHLRKVCFLALPTMIRSASITLSGVRREWIPTSKYCRRSGSSQGCHGLPFYSSTVTTIGLDLCYRTYHYGQRVSSFPSVFECTMIISVTALLSAIRTDVSRVPWTDWGPSCTHLSQTISPTSAGPFWITSTKPLVVCDYDPLRVRKARSKLGPQPQPSLCHVKDEYYEFWEAQKIETHLPYDIIMNDDYSDLKSRFQWFLANREWIVGIDNRPLSWVREFLDLIRPPFWLESDHKRRQDLETGFSITVYRVG